MIKLNDRDILLASMLGNKVMEQLPRFELVQNEIAKRPLPRINVFPLRQNSTTPESYSPSVIESKNWRHQNLTFSFLPVKLTDAVGSYQFKIEPLISVKMKNEIIKRTPAKAKDFVGTIKEYWSQDDYQITMTGFLFGTNEKGSFQDCYPLEDVKILKRLFQSREGIAVENEFLLGLGITRIVIEELSFPFTVGENVQAFEISCISDFTENILLEIV